MIKNLKSYALLSLAVVLSFFLTACDKSEEFIDVPQGQAGYVTVGNYTVKVSVPSDSGNDILYDIRTGNVMGQVIINAVSKKEWPLNCIASELKVEKTTSKTTKVRTFTISGIQSDIEIMLVYAPEYTVSVRANNNQYGFVYGGGEYPEESQVELSARAAGGYIFSEWKDDKGNTVSTDNPLIIDDLSSDISLTAFFISSNIFDDIMLPVDLGLSVMWAPMNVGADNEADRGDYYSWGEIEPKASYLDSTYLLGGKYFAMTGDTVRLKLEDDAAYKNLKVYKSISDPLPEDWVWRLPSCKEFEELALNCSISYGSRTDSNGKSVNGFIATGKNGNSIFIPVNGYYGKNGLKYYETDGNYWTSDRTPDDKNVAYCLSFNPSGDGYSAFERMSRYAGLCVRPVFGPPLD